MPKNLDASDEHARIIREAAGGREFLRVVSILARERPSGIVTFTEAVVALIRESVRMGLMHPDALRELDETRRAN